jgi:hypothetical protein
LLTGIAVADAAEAFRISVENGAKPVTKPVTLKSHADDGQQGEQTIAEVGSERVWMFGARQWGVRCRGTRVHMS